MRALQNLHQHTNFCDGRDSIEDVVLTAIEKGFTGIGFSGHSHTPYGDYAMTPESTKVYRQEIARMKEKYGHQIDIFCGLEYDRCSPERPQGFDYVIGAVHGLELGDVGFEYDGSLSLLEDIIRTHFGGDGMAFAKEYYRQLAWLPDYADCDIIAHFDLITKHRECKEFFDCDSKEYRFAAIEAAEALAGKIPYFEVNTGGIARGYRTTPYPDPFIIKEMKRLGFGAVITADCHQREFMDFAFEQASNLLKSCGYTHYHILTKDGFVPVEL